MTEIPSTTLLPPTMPDRELSENEQVGWNFFWQGMAVDWLGWTEDCIRGWWMGHCVAYGQGVKAACIEAVHTVLDTDHEPAQCPYPQFSAAWEAWGEGNNDMEWLG